MTLARKLLLGGVPTVIGGGVGGGFLINDLVNGSSGENGPLDQPQNNPGESQKPSPVGPVAKPAEGKRVNGRVGVAATPKKDDPKDLIKEAGLDCGDASGDKDCTILPTGLKVDKGGNKREGLTLDGGGNGKIRFRLSNERDDYPEGFRFTIIQGNINLRNGSSESIVLDRYENYYLVKSGGKVYLTRRLTADEGKIKVLGLPKNVVLPTAVTKEGSSFVISQKQIQYIRFDGRQDGGAKSGDNLNLNIYKVNDSNTFKGGYRFSFQPISDLIISNNNTVDRDIWWDFRIKDPNADDLVLEKVWREEKDLLKQVGLTCNGDTCNINNGNLKIKRGSFESKGSGNGWGSGKINIHRKKSGHYEGLRFEIKGGDINLSSSSEKLEELEVYEIQRNNDDSFYLTRKHDVKEMVIFLLGLVDCSLPATGKSTTCTIQSKNLEKVKFFVNGSEQTVRNTSANLSITTTYETSNYPFGYRFSLRPNGNMNIGSVALKANSSYEFKIRKNGSRLQLEKVWDENTLKGKLNLSCSTEGGTETCTFGESSSVNVKIAKETMDGATSYSYQDDMGKLKLTRGAGGYNEGLKFEVTGGDISFYGGSGVTLRMGEFDSYEIKEENGKWYFVQKSSFMDAKVGALGLPGSCKNAFDAPCKFTNVSSVNFKEKIPNGKIMFSNNVEIQLQLERNSYYDFGLKVSMKAAGGNNPHVTVACKSNDTVSLLKLTNQNMDFKIEKLGTSFYLVKATASGSPATCPAGS